jgi:DNA-binding CsgD family transcriptional regulator
MRKIGLEPPLPRTDAVLTAQHPHRTIDLIPHAACVIDAERRLNEQNFGAQALLADSEPLCAMSGRLHCHVREAAAALDRYLVQPGAATGALRLRLPRESPGRDMLVRVERSVVTCTACDSGESFFLVHMFLPTVRWSIPEDVLRETYRLTAGEARVIHLLLRGSRIASVANELGISPATVRTHLKHVMRKLEVSTQVQLTQVLASGPWR